jgi:hypothetical protein
MNLGQYVVIGLSIFLGLWYVVGSSINRKRGLETFRWLRDGLETAGKVTEARWIGSSGSGARLTVGKANRPFQRIEVVFLLDSRELLPLWLVNLLRGKQDEMILKANLRSLPTSEIEVGHSDSKEIKSLISNKQPSTFQTASAAAGFEILYKGKAGDEQIARLQSFIQQYPVSIKRISLKKQMPHLVLRADLPPLREKNLEEFFKDLSTWLSD